jgi:hypothetical protein
MTLPEEARRGTRLLKGRVVRAVRRRRRAEIVIEFDDGTRLFVNAVMDRLEISIT